MKRDRQILDAAAALFYAKGFDGVGVDEIGQRVGISGPAIYHHFSGKNEILERLFTEGLDELLSATTGPVDEAPDPRRELHRLVRRHVQFALDKRHLVNVFQRESRSLAGAGRDGFQHRMREYASRWERALRGCYPQATEAEIRCGAQAAIGLIHSVAYWPASSLQGDDVVGLLCRLVLHGLVALDGPPDGLVAPSSGPSKRRVRPARSAPSPPDGAPPDPSTRSPK